MTTIALLGTGLLGAAMAENLLSRGHHVRVWNRSREKLAPLGKLGAFLAPDPAECVRGASVVHLVLAEDSAVDAVIANLRKSNALDCAASRGGGLGQLLLLLLDVAAMVAEDLVVEGTPGLFCATPGVFVRSSRRLADQRSRQKAPSGETA